MRRRSPTTTRRSTLVVAGMLPVLLVALIKLADLPVLTQVSGLIFDSYQRLAPRAYRDAGVRVVDIDDESIRRLGQWPWPRTDVARLTKAIGDAGAAAIAFDIVFSEADRTSPARIADSAARSGANPQQLAALRSLPDHDARLAEVFAATPSVLGFFLTHDPGAGAVEPKAGFAVAGSAPGGSIAEYGGAILPLPPLRAAAPGLGFVSLRGDADGIVRRVPLIARVNGALVPSLSAETLRVAQGAGGMIVRSSDASGEVAAGRAETVGVKIGEAEVPVTERGELWMHYTGAAAERSVPAWRVLSGTLAPAEMQRLFAGRIVLVGAGASGLRDLVATPVAERELGVVVHAQAIEQMVLGDYLHRPDWVGGLELALLLALGLTLAALLPRMGAAGGALAAAAMIAAVLGGSWYAFSQRALLLDPTAPVLALVACYMVATLFTYVREERQRQYIHAAFDRYLSPEMVKRITEDPSRLELGGEERRMTVLFCDVRGFSRLSERLTPQEVIRFMIAFLTPMTDILLGHRATIDKFIGDAVLAFWNAPLDDPDQYGNAARAALAMSRRLDSLNSEMAAQETTPWPGPVEIGIGLNAGPCCVGNMGSEQRLSYSLIGDTVNLASRIEGLTKRYHVRILIGGELAEKLADFATLEVDRVRVVGRDSLATIHTLVGDAEVERSAPFREFSATHRAMLTEYRARRWNEAQRLVDSLSQGAAAFGLGGLYAYYADAIAEHRRTPPPQDWDGVSTARQK